MVQIIQILDVAFTPFLIMGGVVIFGILSVVALIVFIIVIAVRAQTKKSSSVASASKDSEIKKEPTKIDNQSDSVEK